LLRRGRHLKLTGPVRGDDFCDLTLDRGEQRVLRIDLRFDRRLRGRALRDDALLLHPCLRKQLVVALHRCAEGLHLREDTCVERRDALGAVHARDHVVEAARAEDNLERRCLIGCVKGDEALRDHALARLQVVLRELQLMPVDPQVMLDLRELLRRRVVLRTGALERIRDCRQKSDADPRKYVRRLSQPTNDNPRSGNGTGAPGGAGTSR